MSPKPPLSQNMVDCFFLAVITILLIVSVGQGATEDRLPPDTKVGRKIVATAPAPSHHLPRLAVKEVSFRGLTPGHSTVADLRKAWGEPTETREEQKGLLYAYSDETFERIDVQVVDSTIVAMVIHLGRPFSPQILEKKLGLTRIESVDVVNAQGETIGRAFPERGVLFSIVREEGSLQVAEVLLENLDPQSFVLRVETKLYRPRQDNLRDLRQAIQLDPKYARPYWLLARMELAVDRLALAEKGAAMALKLQPDVAEYRLTWARCLGRQGHLQQAVEQVHQALRAANVPTVIQAHGQMLLGELEGLRGAPNYKRVVDLYLAAIELADPCSVAKNQSDRRAAKELLVDAHLAVAGAIAAGNWQKKSQVVSEWIERAADYAQDMIDNEGDGAVLRLQMALSTLKTLSRFDAVDGLGTYLGQAEEAAEKILMKAEDPVYKNQVRWQLAEAYFAALEIAHKRGELQEGVQYGTRALEQLEPNLQGHQDSPMRARWIALLYFQIGVLHAVQGNDHQEAVIWYEKALPGLVDVRGVSTSSVGREAEALVSMGVTYWEVGDRGKAVELTELGAERLRQAVQSGSHEGRALEVPYNNLARMYEVLGDQKRARSFAAMASGKKKKISQRR